MKLRQLLKELKRRNVIKTAGAYGVAAWLLIQVAVTIKAPLHLPNWIDTVVIIAVIVGFPIALIIAWVFELTPDGLQKTDEIAKSESKSLTQSTGKKLNRIIIGSLSLVIVLLITERVFLAGDLFLEVQPSIAVLPFVNISSDIENEYFADGLSEELLTRLGKFESLSVKGRTSSFSFKGKETSYEEIGETLNVDHVLEGSVRKFDDQIRISASLVRIKDGRELWSSTFARKLDDVFEIQEEVSRNVIAELKVQLLPEEEQILSRRPTEVLGAYEAYLKATQLETSRLSADIDSSIVYYKKAIELDSEFSDAYARLAYALGLKNDYGSVPIDELESLMRTNIETALILDPENPKAYESLGYLYYRRYRQFEFDIANMYDSLDLTSARQAYEKALALNETPSILSGLAAVIFNDDINQANELNARAFSLDPLNNRIACNYANSLGAVGEFNKAEEIFNLVLLRNPDYSLAYYSYAELKSRGQNELDKAFNVLYQGYKNIGPEYNIMSSLIILAIDMGMPELSVQFTDTLNQRYPESALFHDLNTILATQDFEGLKDIKPELLEVMGIDILRVFDVMEIELLILEKDYPEALALLDIELQKAPNPFLTPGSLQDLYAITLKLNGEEERADSMFIELRSELEFFKTSQGMIATKALKMDKESANEFYDSLYFSTSESSKYAFLSQSVTDMRAYILDQMGALNSIKRDRNRMRRNVITYLRSLGDWNEDWKIDDNQLTNVANILK